MRLILGVLIYPGLLPVIIYLPKFNSINSENNKNEIKEMISPIISKENLSLLIPTISALKMPFVIKRVFIISTIFLSKNSKGK